MTRDKAVLRAQALFRLSRDKAATVAEAELAAEHLEKLRQRFDLLPHEVHPQDYERTPKPAPPAQPYPVAPTWIIINGVPIPVQGRVQFTYSTGTASSFNW